MNPTSKTELRERCAVENTPVISVDTKKKELVGAFRNPGAKGDRSPELVNDHDFRSDAEGRAIPYGIYDPRANAGTVFVGQTADTPAFAVDCIEKWWRTEGRKHYPDAQALQILADGGGSNSCTARAWKFNLQHRLCNRHALRVTVAHYPPATSKWNPIEHRLFCEVSKNWAGRPLDSYETILKYLRTTRTTTGLFHGTAGDGGIFAGNEISPLTAARAVTKRTNMRLDGQPAGASARQEHHRVVGPALGHRLGGGAPDGRRRPRAVPRSAPGSRDRDRGEDRPRPREIHFPGLQLIRAGPVGGATIQSASARSNGASVLPDNWVTN